MMWEIFLVAVNADQILERAGDAGLTVQFKLGQIDNHIRIDHLTRYQVLVNSWIMCFGQ